MIDPDLAERMNHIGRKAREGDLLASTPYLRTNGFLKARKSDKIQRLTYFYEGFAHEAVCFCAVDQGGFGQY